MDTTLQKKDDAQPIPPLAPPIRKAAEVKAEPKTEQVSTSNDGLVTSTVKTVNDGISSAFSYTTQHYDVIGAIVFAAAAASFAIWRTMLS